MKKSFLLVAFVTIYLFSSAQKIEGIYFNLYTDSLKKGFYNYINVDAKFSDGNWQPLDSSQIIFSSNGGKFKGNDLFIDSAYSGETVVITAILRSNPKIWKKVTIHIRKRGFDEPLKTDEEILNEMKQNGRRKKSAGFA